MFNQLNKPEYFFQPKKALQKLFGNKRNQGSAVTPWNVKLEINPSESIGESIANTSIYDLAITEVLWRLTKPGNTCLDIGANIGYTGSILSYRGGSTARILLFEPNQKLYARLNNNVAHYPFHNTTLHTYALSDKNEMGYLHIPQEFSGNEGIASVTNTNDEDSVSIELRRLDDIIDANTEVGVAKIDVEGHELNVLKGSNKLLKLKRIKNIVYEDHVGYPSEVSSYLESFGYKIYRIEKGFFKIKLKDPTTKSQLASWEPANFLASVEDNVKKHFASPFYQSLA